MLLPAAGSHSLYGKKKDANGKGSGLYDFTSLMRNDKKILLEMLPSKLGEVLNAKSCATVVQIWKVMEIKISTYQITKLASK